MKEKREHKSTPVPYEFMEWAMSNRCLRWYVFPQAAKDPNDPFLTTKELFEYWQKNVRDEKRMGKD